MSRIDVIMPQMGESIAEGTLSKWLKQVGEEVKRDEPIFEISTDKVDAEIPAPAAGVLAEVLVKQGETVAVNTVVARLETDKASVSSGGPAAAPAPPPPASAAPAPSSPPPAPPAPVAPTPSRPSAGPSAPSPPAVPAVAGPPALGNGPETAEERLRRRSTPLVRKIAAEHGIDIAGVPGSGHAGRVTKSDILGVIGGGVASPARPAPPFPAPTAPPSAAVISHAAPAIEAWPGDRVEPWSRIRKLTAEHMVMSRRVSAHVQTLFAIDYTRVAEVRSRLKKSYAERGVNLTYLAFIAKAVAGNLRQHVGLNAAVGAEATIYRREINLGIAVALDWGLIVPVVKQADELSLLGLARALQDLGERARTKKLNPDEVQRGTFTITNPGVFGSYAGLPIINQPQVAILGVGAIEKRPAVVTLPDGTEAIAPRLMGMLTMSFDHRVVDGADADRFLADVKRTLEGFPDESA